MGAAASSVEGSGTRYAPPSAEVVMLRQITIENRRFTQNPCVGAMSVMAIFQQLVPLRAFMQHNVVIVDSVKKASKM